MELTKYNNSVSLTFLSLVFLIFLIIMMMTRNKKLQTKTNIYFKLLIIFGFMLCFSEFAYSYTIPNESSMKGINLIITEMFIYFANLSIEEMLLYMLYKSGLLKNINKKNLFFVIAIEVLVPLLIILIFPLVYNNTTDLCYLSGTQINITYTYSVILGITMLLVITKRKKEMEGINLIPFYFVFLFYAFLILIEITTNITINDLALFITCVIVTLYLTIENQDSMIAKEYAKLKDDAEKANKSKERFLNSMSHEIRTPMNKIIGFSTLILENNNLTEEYAKTNFQYISSSSIQLTDLINNILDISKLESNKIIINNKTYSLKNMIYEINSLISARINKENLKFSIQVNESIPEYYEGDDYLLIKCITNVLKNAIEYTNYGEVKLLVNANKLDNNDYELQFTIANSGHLMMKENFEKELEDLFSNNDNIETTIDNIKLCLIVAKRLIKKMSGEISFLNEKGQGTKYFIKIRQKVTNTNAIGNIYENNDLNKINILNNKKILIIAKQDSSIRLLIKYLQRFQINIYTLEKGKEAVQSIKTSLYDAIFIEDMLEDLTPEEVLKGMESTGYKIPPVIQLLSNSYNNDENEFISKGFYGILNKSTSFRNVCILINKLFKEVK